MPRCGKPTPPIITQTHWYYTINPSPDGKDADKLKGKEYQTDYRSSGGTLLRQRLATWNNALCCLVNNGGVYSINNVSYWVYLQQEQTITGTTSAQVRYAYDVPSVSPPNAGYGNLIQENRDGDTSITTDDATMFYAYNRNTTANILDTIKSKKTYVGNKTSDDGVGLTAETYQFYDGNNADGQLGTAPTKGDLTRLKQATTVGTTYVNAYYTYDTYGNKLSELDPNGNLRSWTYHATYNNLPITETYPSVGGAPSMQESATWDYGAAKILSWTGVNGQTISYEYDTFKRLTKIIKPGDTSASPSIRYNYNSWGTIGSQNLETVVKIDAGNSLWSRQFFDGLGRVVQVQSKGETEGSATYTIVNQTIAYSNRGLVDKDYVSQKLDSTTVSGYKAPEASWKFTQSAYDGIGRVTTLTKPDGATISHAYSNWQNAVTNERGNITTYAYDAFGRLVQVQEPTGGGTTSYQYDVLGNLKQVTDAANNQTTINYDAISRKTSMTDPDMGTWSYQYDANGNLTSQTDAKSQVVVFQYDALNRLTKKCTPTCAGTTLATYSYDASSPPTNYGKGRRTGMTDTSGSAAWIYDNRGHVTKEDKTIDGALYTTQYAYDGADRITSITYPTGEVVTQGYNGRGLPNTLSGSVAGSLVTGALYNQLGQSTQIDLGNGLRSVFNYHGIDSVDAGDANSYWGKLYRIRTLKVADSTDRQHLKHWWDAAGNLTQRTDAVASQTESFTYDALDRLTSSSIGAPSNGLIARWDLDEGSGTTTADSSGNGYNGTLVGGAAWVDGRLGKALSFDGVDDYVDAGDINAAEGIGAFSVAAWVKPSTRAPGVGNPAIVSKFLAWDLYIEGNNGGFTFRFDDGAGWSTDGVTYSATLSVDTWYHVVAAYDGSACKMYVNGNEVASSPCNGTIRTTAYAVRIGQWFNNEWFKGVIDEVRLYNRGLSPSEVQTLYTATKDTYTYNPIGNILSKGGVSYTYGSKPHAVTAVGATSYTYDGNGNMTARGSQTLTWDVENRVSTVSSSSNTLEGYTYDGYSQRVKRVAYSPPTAGLVAAWALNEGSGTTTADSSGNGNNATLLNGPTWVDGWQNKALSFDGVDDYVSTTAITTGDVTTFSLRFFPTRVGNGGTGGYSCALIAHTNGANGWWVEWRNNGSLELGTYVGGGYTPFQIETNFTALNTWHFLAGTITKNGAVKIWLDGNLKVDTTIGAWTDANGAIRLATDSVTPPNNPNAYNQFFNGIIDEVRIYNRALSAGEVSALAGSSTIHYANKFYEKNVTSGEVTSYYYLGDKLVALRKGTTLEYIHQEHLGGSFVSTDGNGAQKASISYSPYGATRASTGSLGTDKKFTGQRLDGTGLYFYNARYYDPGIGRFISPDSIVPGFSNPQALNRYSYVRNNSLKYTDLSGHCPLCLALVAKAGIGASVGFGTYALQVAFFGEPFTFKGASISAVSGAVGGGLTGGTTAAGKVVLARTGSTVVSQLVKAGGTAAASAGESVTERSLQAGRLSANPIKTTVAATAGSLAAAGTEAVVSRLADPFTAAAVAGTAQGKVTESLTDLVESNLQKGSSENYGTVVITSPAPNPSLVLATLASTMPVVILDPETERALSSR